MWGSGKRVIESMTRKRQLIDRGPRLKGRVSDKARAGRETQGTCAESTSAEPQPRSTGPTPRGSG